MRVRCVVEFGAKRKKQSDAGIARAGVARCQEDDKGMS